MLSERIPRIYLDTSIFGGVFDSEFEEPGKEFVRQIRLGIYSIVVSDVVRREIEGAIPPFEHYSRISSHLPK